MSAESYLSVGNNLVNNSNVNNSNVKMHRAVVSVNKVPITVETWGRWIEETPLDKNERLILCIPGNPGVTGFYQPFLKRLHEKLECPVWIIGHTGHQTIPGEFVNAPPLSGNENLYNVQGQTDVKAAFFRKYIPEGTKVYLIGHSIGAYICLQLLQDAEIRTKVEKAYLLFPAIENIAKTRNGIFMLNIIWYITWIIFFLSWIFTILPTFIKNVLLYCYFTIMKISTANMAPCREMINPESLKKIFFMAYDEMEILLELNQGLIEPNLDKIKLYYGATDNWAPASYCRCLKEKFPGVDATVCVRNFEHAFVLRQSEEVANMVAGWILSN